MSRDLVANLALLVAALALAGLMILGAKHRDDNEEGQDDDQNHFI